MLPAIRLDAVDVRGRRGNPLGVFLNKQSFSALSADALIHVNTQRQWIQ